jgi:GntR family transcriptional regulator/MocR family aminotransferase
MFLELDGCGPHYAQLTRALKTAILTGRAAAGMRLPPTRGLAQELELSRTTVLAAYEQLRAEGFIEGRVGSGSYVAELRLEPRKLPAGTIPATASSYTRRARIIEKERKPFWSHAGVRYSLLSCAPLLNPAFVDLWGRELAHAARHTTLEGFDSQGLPALRQQVCDYLARQRGVFALSTTTLHEAMQMLGQCLDEIDACRHRVRTG